MNVHSYWRNLQRGHAQAMSQAAVPGPVDRNLSFILAAICAVAALILATTGGYRAGFEAIHRLGGYSPAMFLETLSTFGETLSAICLIGLIARRQPCAVWMGVLASVYATTLTHALKGLFDTARPAAMLGDWVAVTGPVLKLHSFPSGHTMTAFLLAACFSIGATRGTRLVLYTLAAAVGFSRVWVGAHWPMDVLAGAGIAGLSVALAIRTTKFTSWGLGLGPHLLFVSLIAACAILELAKGSEYPLARLLSSAIALPSLYVLARDYVFRPLLLKQVEVGHASSKPPEPGTRPHPSGLRVPERCPRIEK